jgi:hypothetical protein
MVPDVFLGSKETDVCSIVLITTAAVMICYKADPLH